MLYALQGYTLHTEPQSDTIAFQGLVATVCVNASACPCKRLSMAMVALLREQI